VATICKPFRVWNGSESQAANLVPSGDMISLRGNVLVFKREVLIALIAALALLGPAYVGIFASGVRTVLSPLPLFTVVPAMMLAQWHLEYAALLLPALFFLLWNPQLGRGEGEIPKRTYVFFLLLAVLNGVGFIVDWKLGIKYRLFWVFSG
jgi:hypothetical protein